MRPLAAVIGRWLAFGPWVLVVLAIVDWALLRRGYGLNPPELLAALVGGAMVGFLCRVAVLLARLRSDAWSARWLAESVLLFGVLIALGAGSANWLFGLQGFVILNEKEAVRLHGGDQLQAFEAGPMARLEEMGYFLALNELELTPAGAGGFLPRSLVDVWREGEERRRLEVSPRMVPVHGALRFHQGAFGFSPRIVIVKGTETLFDRVVPFTTERSGRSGISFAGRFTVERERLDVDGRVDLTSLDEGMRGHASLLLTVRRGGELLGRGRLLPGSFADIEQGFRIGFAGLEQWSELIVSRRNYGRLVKVGAAVALVGALLLPWAVWRCR